MNRHVLPLSGELQKLDPGDRWLLKGEEIANEIHRSERTLYNGRTGRFSFLTTIDGKLATTVFSAHNCRDNLLPADRKAAAQQRGKAGAAAVGHDHRGRFTAVNSGSPRR